MMRGTSRVIRVSKKCGQLHEKLTGEQCEKLYAF